ncbi:hypothetical protein WNY81_08735 [Shewanella frigidimarina]|uniref:hypothetical protein n=1 Tax=Shewanella frigidimarina TaxID=56812 RepID=UPI003170508D
MASTNETTDNFDVWLVWLKRAAYISIILFISIILSYFFNFATWPLTMSSLTADWSAFGSLLAGSASFLGAIGTVGVMLLGIKQFKIQQAQIVAQTKRQDNFEEKQDKKWTKENEILNFQKYQMHTESFNQRLDGLERKWGISFKDNTALYISMFPNNDFYSLTYYSKKESWISELDIYLHQLHNSVKEYNIKPRAKNFFHVAQLVIAVENALSFNFNDADLNYKNDNVLKLQIKNTQKIVDIGIDTANKLTSFSKYQSYNYHNLKFDIKVFIQDIEHSVSSRSTYVKGDLLDFFVLLDAATKSNMPIELYDLYNLSMQQFNSQETSPKNDEIEKHRQLILTSSLEVSEQNFLIEKLDIYNNELLTKSMS